MKKHKIHRRKKARDIAINQAILRFCSPIRTATRTGKTEHFECLHWFDCNGNVATDTFQEQIERIKIVVDHALAHDLNIDIHGRDGELFRLLRTSGGYIMAKLYPRLR